MLSTANSLKKFENLQKITWRFFCNDYEISNEELLLKFPTSLMNVKRLRPASRPIQKKYKLNQVSYGKKC